MMLAPARMVQRLVKGVGAAFIGILAAACGHDATRPAWDPLREALVSAEFAAVEDVAIAALAADGAVTRIRVDDVAFERAPTGETLPGDTLGALARLDELRLRAGHDAAAALVLEQDGGSVVARSCAPLLQAPEAAPADVVAAWIAACGLDPARMTVRDQPGMPALVAAWPQRGVVYVHPMLRELLGRLAEARSGPGLAVRSAALAVDTSDFDACVDDMLDYCLACAEDAARCERLFPGSTEPDVCDWAGTTRRSAEIYCVGALTGARPDLAWCVARLEPEVACIAPGPPPLDAAELAARFATFNRGNDVCWPAFTECSSENGGSGWLATLDSLSLAACEADLAFYCATCGAVQPGECEPLFRSSTPAADCLDLERAELAGFGYRLYCAREIAEAQPQWRGCLNALETCVDYDVPVVSFETLVEAYLPFADPRTTDDCAQQAAACASGVPVDPLPPWEVPPPPTAEEDKKCCGR
jgi:hypothetical protein